MKQRIPLVGQPNQRNLDSLQALIEGKDQSYKNGLIIPIYNSLSQSVKHYFEKRPGLEQAFLCDGEPVATGCLGQTLFYSRTTGKYISVFCDDNVYVDCSVLPSELAPANDNPGYFLAFTDADSPSLGAISLDDGVTWDLITLSDTTVGWNPGATWMGNNKWASVSASTNVGALSTDGGNTFSAVTFPTAPNAYQNIKFGGADGGYILAVSTSLSTTPGLAAKSVDRGNNYTSHNIATFTNSRALFWCKELGLWVTAGGLADLGKRLLTSPDGEVWTGRTVDNARYKEGVWTGEAAIVVGDDGFTRSEDGLTWDPTDISITGVDIIYDGTALVAVANNTAYVSEDHGVTWDSFTIGAGLAIYVTLATNGTTICALSYNDGVSLDKGFSATSTDHGHTWTERQNMPLTDNWIRVRAAYNRPGYL